MADFSTLIASIEATIKENGVQAITGQVLQDELLLTVSAINQLKQDTLEGYAFYGEPLPNGATRVVTQNTFFLAGAGSYTINGNAVTITDSGISVIVYDCVNDEITTYQLFAYDANPTSGSGNAVTSGGVKSALDTKADKNGASPDLFAGFAGNLVDTRSAGTHQGPFAFRQSGGDGVNYMRKILGRTEAWNQLVGDNDTEVTVTSGHKYFAIIGGTASVATSDGSPISVEGGVDIVTDLTLMYGAGNEPATPEAFEALHPLPYYNYNAGVLKNNAADGIATDGFNQFPSLPVNCMAESWPAFDATQCARVFANTEYHIHHDNLGVTNWRHIYKIYDLNGNEIKQDGIFISTEGAPYYNSSANISGFVDAVDNTNTEVRFKVNVDCYVFFGFGSGAVASGTTISNFCINLSDASRNGTYEPYWKREIVLGLDNLACHDENNNAVVVNGLDGVGTSQDELIVENGWGTKINKRRARVDLGGLSWRLQSGYTDCFYALIPGGVGSNDGICPKYVLKVGSGYLSDKEFVLVNNEIYIKDSAYSDAVTFKAAMSGVYLDYELATPKVLTLDNPIPALIEVDNLGTEKRLSEDTADNPQAPFECDSNYSISTANLVRKLSE